MDRRWETEDHQLIGEGMEAFNYYDRVAGVVKDIDNDGWFDFIQIDGTKKILNGERICSIEYAIRKGWLPKWSGN